MSNVFFVFIGFSLGIVALVFYKGMGVIYSWLFEAKVYLNNSKDTEWIPILEKEFPFYNKLPAESKKLFLSKANYFYRGKNFIPKSGFHIDERKKLLICASAAQLTFGLPLLKLPHFKDILIYPSSYYNKFTQRKHEGEVNTRGLIVFSWEHIQKGFDNPVDGKNVALHELAHALRFEDFYPNEERNFLSQADVTEFYHLFKKVKQLSNTGLPTFLNSYAFTNLEEFFAVSVESFFERPIEFKSKMPDLYNCMCKLLNQDTFLLENLNKNKVKY